MVGASVLMVSHGYEVREGEDPLIDIVEAALAQAAVVLTPGAFLVDSFPLLRYFPNWLPGAGYKKNINEWRSVFGRMADVPHSFVKERMVRTFYSKTEGSI